MSRTIYEIIPSSMFGWNFKNSESRHVIKYADNKKELICYAENYCRSHKSEIIIYSCFLEKENVITFEGSEITFNKQTVIL
jgi:hypothetical protein